MMSVQSLFQEYFEAAPAISARAPGRVNLMGAHVDFNDGPVMPAAIDHAVYLAGAADEDNMVSLHAHYLEATTTFQLDAWNLRLISMVIPYQIGRSTRPGLPGPCSKPGWMSQG